VLLSRNLDQNMPKNSFFKKKFFLRKIPETLGAPPPNPHCLPAVAALPQTPSYFSHILLQLQNLKALVGETQKYFTSRLMGTLATPLII